VTDDRFVGCKDEFPTGDVNADGGFDLVDTLLLRQALVGLAVSICIQLGDFAGLGFVGLQSFVASARCQAGLTTTFPSGGAVE
jgi:hypothetical protein